MIPALAHEFKILLCTMERVIKVNLGMRSYRRPRVHMICAQVHHLE